MRENVQNFLFSTVGVILYVIIVPNVMGRSMPAFYMLCSKNKESGQEALGFVQPFGIIIGESDASLNAINAIVFKYCVFDFF